MASQSQNVVVLGSAPQGPENMDADVVEEEELICGDCDEDEDINFVDDGSTLDADTNKFDHIVGALGDILMDQEFEDAREAFCRRHCGIFEENGENKLEYTVVFEQYVGLVEATIETRLSKAVPGFDMQDFMRMLNTRKDELMDDVFDLLLSLGDFEAFKEVMVSYKKEVAAAASSSSLCLSCTAVRIHVEEQEDGDERPDLDFGLTVTSAKTTPTGKAGPSKIPLPPK